MTTYNDIGIDSKLDWKRISKLFKIGLVAGIIVLIGDMLLGWGVADERLSGIERELSPYLMLSDTRIFSSAFLGLIGIPLEGLSCFGIYRLMAGKSLKHAHAYRSGIIGCLIFGACGVHVLCLSSVFFYKYIYAVNPENALELAMKYGSHFLITGMIFYMILFLVLCYTQISAFVKGMTPYPKWCWIFSLPVGMLLAMLFKVFGNHAWVNAITAGWVNVGYIWMFGGLLATMRLTKKEGK